MQPDDSWYRNKLEYVKLCRFRIYGECRRGLSCGFAHVLGELRKPQWATVETDWPTEKPDEPVTPLLCRYLESAYFASIPIPEALCVRRVGPGHWVTRGQAASMPLKTEQALEYHPQAEVVNTVIALPDTERASPLLELAVVVNTAIALPDIERASPLLALEESSPLLAIEDAPPQPRQQRHRGNKIPQPSHGAAAVWAGAAVDASASDSLPAPMAQAPLPKVEEPAQLEERVRKGVKLDLPCLH